jgi:hypothetical protein
MILFPVEPFSSLLLPFPGLWDDNSQVTCLWR